MGKKEKKLNSLDDLKKIKIEEGGFTEKSKEEIAMQKIEEDMNQSSQQEVLDVNHTIEIPTDVYENINNRNQRINLIANAPYNFIPLNENVVNSDFNINKVPFDRYHDNLFTGYISLNVKTETPIYLKDLLTKEESIELDNLNEELKTLANSSEEFRSKYERKMEIIKNFYSPGDGKYKISGSTLRGLTRNNVEIVSYSKIGFIDKDRKFHYRAMADRSWDLKAKYSDEMLDGDRNTGFFQKVKAGYLFKSGNHYKIKPVDSPNPNCQFFRVEEDTVINAGVLTDRMSIIKPNGRRDNNKSYTFGFKKIKFTFQPYTRHNNYSQPLLFSKVDNIYNIDDTRAPANAHEGVLVHTGWIPSNNVGKHIHWVIGKASSNSIELLPGVIDDYKNDEGRDKNANLLDWFEKFHTNEVPCFYLEENGMVNSFGHTGIFRLAYDRALKNFIPNSHLNNKFIDLTEAIFGNELTFAGRVFFEDAEFKESGSPNPHLEPRYLQILSNPKPTTFQHYIVQKGITPKYLQSKNQRRNGNFQGVEGLRDYNSTDVSIRGSKLYWHKKNNNYFASDEDIQNHLNQLTKVACIDKNTTFTGRIRFENLSNVELGALLFALDLPEGCCHKIGMAKPLGLGSIKITPTLHLSDIQKRYKDISAEWSSDIKESTDEGKKMDDFKNDFATYILNALNGDQKKSTSEDLWNVDRMKELKKMLTFNHGIPLDKIKYMVLGEFRNRPVLPKPSDVN